MEKEHFNEIKKDFICQYNTLLCSESMEDINKAEDWHSFVDVLRKYSIYNNYRPFPNVEWARKWFAEDKSSINEEGIYLDQVVNVENQNTQIMCYGKCSGFITFNVSGRYRIMLQDESSVHLFVNADSIVFAKLKGDAKIWTMKKTEHTIIKERRYETKNATQWG